jgi:hypothetical protein
LNPPMGTPVVTMDHSYVTVLLCCPTVMKRWVGVFICNRHERTMDQRHLTADVTINNTTARTCAAEPTGVSAVVTICALPNSPIYKV